MVRFEKTKKPLLFVLLFIFSFIVLAEPLYNNLPKVYAATNNDEYYYSEQSGQIDICESTGSSISCNQLYTPSSTNTFVCANSSSSLCLPAITKDPSSSAKAAIDISSSSCSSASVTQQTSVGQFPQFTTTNLTIYNTKILQQIGPFRHYNLKCSVGQSSSTYSMPNPPSANSTNSTSVAPTIKCNVTFNPLTWLLCPAVDGMLAIVNQLENALNNALSVGSADGTTNPSQIFCSGTITTATRSKCSAYESAWSDFRDIALGILLIIGIVIVVSQAIGADFLDAYTVKKAMPRLVVAAVLISLSWPLLQFSVTLTNALGYGIQQIIYAPFADVIKYGDSLSGSGQAALNLVGGGAIAAMGIFAVLSFAVTAALGVFVAYLIIVIRQILVVILIIVAPIGIACMVLPNTHKVYKLWFDELRLALLMFPIITGLIAFGRVFSAISLDSPNPNILDQFIGFAAFFAPYFILPWTFRFAGGALSTISGKVQQGHQGAFGRVSQFRTKTAQARRKRLYERSKSGNLIRGKGTEKGKGLLANINRTAESATLIGAGGATLNMKKRRARMQNARSVRQQEEAAKGLQDNELLKHYIHDESMLNAGYHNYGDENGIRNYLMADKPTKYTSTPEGQEALRRDTDLILSTQRTMGQDAYKRASLDAMAATGVVFKDPADMLKAIKSTYGSDRVGASNALGRMKKATMDAGQVHIGAASAKSLYGNLDKIYNDPDISNDVVNRDAYDSVINSNQAGALAYGKEGSVKALAEHFNNRLQNQMKELNDSTLTIDERKEKEKVFKQTLAHAHAVHDNLRGSSLQNAQIFADGLMGQEIDVSSLIPVARAALGPSSSTYSSRGPQQNLTIRQAMDNLAGQDQEYLNIRTDYATKMGLADEERRRAALSSGLPGGPPGGPPVDPLVGPPVGP